MESMLSTCRMKSPLGEVLLVADSHGDALCGLYLERQKYFPADAERWREAGRLPVLRDAVAQLHEYFTGARHRFDLALAPVGTSFQRDVWAAIGDVPYGETITYRELARRCGRPSAVRAAATATGRNPITVIVPCHRIIGSDGSLTGYAGGLDRKRALLDLECGQMTDSLRRVA